MPSVLTCTLRKGGFDCRLVSDGEKTKYSNVQEIELSGALDTNIMQNSVIVSTDKKLLCEFNKKEGLLSCKVGVKPSAEVKKEEKEVPWWEQFKI